VPYLLPHLPPSHLMIYKQKKRRRFRSTNQQNKWRSETTPQLSVQQRKSETKDVHAAHRSPGAHGRKPRRRGRRGLAFPGPPAFPRWLQTKSWRPQAAASAFRNGNNRGARSKTRPCARRGSARPGQATRCRRWLPLRYPAGTPSWRASDGRFPHATPACLCLVRAATATRARPMSRRRRTRERAIPPHPRSLSVASSDTHHHSPGRRSRARRHFTRSGHGVGGRRAAARHCTLRVQEQPHACCSHCVLLFSS
jgi:hypothetical protein